MEEKTAKNGEKSRKCGRRMTNGHELLPSLMLRRWSAGEKSMAGGRSRTRHFRILAVILSALIVLVMTQLPAKVASIERQHQQLDEAAQVVRRL